MEGWADICRRSGNQNCLGQSGATRITLVLSLWILRRTWGRRGWEYLRQFIQDNRRPSSLESCPTDVLEQQRLNFLFGRQIGPKVVLPTGWRFQSRQNYVFPICGLWRSACWDSSPEYFAHLVGMSSRVWCGSSWTSSISSLSPYTHEEISLHPFSLYKKNILSCCLTELQEGEEYVAGYGNCPQLQEIDICSGLPWGPCALCSDCPYVLPILCICDYGCVGGGWKKEDLHLDPVSSTIPERLWLVVESLPMYSYCPCPVSKQTEARPSDNGCGVRWTALCMYMEPSGLAGKVQGLRVTWFIRLFIAGKLSVGR